MVCYLFKEGASVLLSSDLLILPTPVPKFPTLLVFFLPGKVIAFPIRLGALNWKWEGNYVQQASVPTQWVFHGVLISGSGHRALRQALTYLGGSIHLKAFFVFI